jgi:hypothetical protein
LVFLIALVQPLSPTGILTFDTLAVGYSDCNFF